MADQLEYYKADNIFYKVKGMQVLIVKNSITYSHYLEFDFGLSEKITEKEFNKHFLKALKKAINF